MTDNLPAEYRNERELMEDSGQGSFQGIDLPTLRVNYDSEDDDGNPLPRGTWAISLPDGRTAYAADAKRKGAPAFLRVYHATHQYSHFDPENMKMISKSVHFYNFSEEIPDNTGGFKCGKVNKKKLEELTDGEKEVQRQIKCSRVLFSTVTFPTAVDMHGEPIEVVDVPCVFYAKGTNYMPMSEMLQNLFKKRTPMQTVILELNLDKQKNGGVTYWQVVPSVKEQVELSPEVFELHNQFKETVKGENESILGKFETAHNKRARVASSKNAAARIAGPADDLDDNIDDLSGDLASDFEENPIAAG